jgi:multidrug efflux pump subunit AcrB
VRRQQPLWELLYSFLLPLFSVLAISVNTLEEVEESRFSIYVTMPTGSTLEATDLVVAEVESRLEGIEERQDVIANIQEEDAILR